MKEDMLLDNVGKLKVQCSLIRKYNKQINRKTQQSFDNNAHPNLKASLLLIRHLSGKWCLLRRAMLTKCPAK